MGNILTPWGAASPILTGSVHLLDILFRPAHKIPQKVLQNSTYSFLTPQKPVWKL